MKRILVILLVVSLIISISSMTSAKGWPESFHKRFYGGNIGDIQTFQETGQGWCWAWLQYETTDSDIATDRGNCRDKKQIINNTKQIKALQ